MLCLEVCWDRHHNEQMKCALELSWLAFLRQCLFTLSTGMCRGPSVEIILLFCRQCSSGLQAIASVVASIKAGYYSLAIAGGVETMSLNPMAWEGNINPRIQKMQHTQSCLMPMGYLKAFV